MSPLHDAPADSPVLVNAENVSKHFTLRRDNSLKDRLLAFRNGRRNRENFTALNGVNLEVRAGHTVALIGHNGSGKSTLLKIIGGILDPSSGSISRRGRVAALLELGAGFHPDLSGRENVFLNASLLGMSREETNSVFDDIVTFAEIEEFIDTQVKFYSSGMYVRLAFAVAIHTDPDILLVDEVLAVGDEAFQRKCMDTIRRFQAEGRTILLVTHSLEQVIELADQALLLHHGLPVYHGDPREAVRKFRTLLEENRVTVGSRNANIDAAELTTATINNVRVEPSEAGNNIFRTGESISVTVEFAHRNGIDDWIYAVQVDNTMGQKVIGFDSDRSNASMPSLREASSYTATLEHPMFGEGRYFVNISMLSNGIHLADAPQAVSFEVVGGHETSGVLAARAHFAPAGPPQGD